MYFNSLTSQETSHDEESISETTRDGETDKGDSIGEFEFSKWQKEPVDKAKEPVKKSLLSM